MRIQTTARHRRAGFSMAELMVALAILGILVIIAAPRMSGMVRGSRLSAAVNQVSSDITYTRLRAIRAGQPAALTVASSTSYTVSVNGTVVKTVSLDKDYTGVTVAQTPGAATFNSRGLLANGSAVNTITVTASGVTRTLTINTIGKVTRDF
jgi:prepilin-type N-terminal cleavage/methylation domain-containing protein